MKERTPKRRHGPAPLPESLKRRHQFGVYFSDSERAELVRRALPGGTDDLTDLGIRRYVGRYLRDAALGTLPPTIPEVNREAWLSLAKVAGNLAQYQAAINAGNARGYPPKLIEELRAQVQQLRSDLLGVSYVNDEEDDDYDATPI